MGNQRNRITEFVDKSGASALSLTGKPIIEIAGDRRVLVENHLGVKEYSREKIGIQVSYGSICITGSSLELLHMTKEQLVVCGNIQSIYLLRKEKPCVL